MSTRKTWYRVDTDDNTGEELVVRKRTVNQPEGFHATLDEAREAYAAPAAEKPPAQIVRPSGIESQESVHANQRDQSKVLPEMQQMHLASLQEMYPFAEFASQGSTVLMDQFAKVKNCLPAKLDTCLQKLQQHGLKVNATKLHKILVNIAVLDTVTAEWKVKQ